MTKNVYNDNEIIILTMLKTIGAGGQHSLLLRLTQWLMLTFLD